MFDFMLHVLANGIMIISIVFAYRNIWVGIRRNKLNRIENGVHIISQYADYDTMVLKLWIWDIEKFKITNICK